MRHVYTNIILLLFISCSPNPNTYIKYLNGYWEIEKVSLSDGSHRNYNFNNTIDFISINDSLMVLEKR